MCVLLRQNSYLCTKIRRTVLYEHGKASETPKAGVVISYFKPFCIP